MRQFLQVVVGLIVCVLLLSVSDVSAQRPRKAKRRGQTRTIVNKPQSIRAEAEAEANKLVGAFLTRCGDSYYSYYGGITEWAGLHLEVNHEPPTLPKKLNGVEWEATILFKFEAERVRLGSPWQAPVDLMCLDLRKENGTWKVDACFEFQKDLYNTGIPPKQKITCEEIERLKKQ